MAAVGNRAKPVREIDRRRDEAPEFVDMHFAVLADSAEIFVEFRIAVRIPGGIQTEIFISGRLQLSEKLFQIRQCLLLVDGGQIAVEAVPARRRNFCFRNQHLAIL